MKEIKMKDTTWSLDNWWAYYGLEYPRYEGDKQDLEEFGDEVWDLCKSWVLDILFERSRESDNPTEEKIIDKYIAFFEEEL